MSGNGVAKPRPRSGSIIVKRSHKKAISKAMITGVTCSCGFSEPLEIKTKAGDKISLKHVCDSPMIDIRMKR